MKRYEENDGGRVRLPVRHLGNDITSQSLLSTPLPQHSLSIGKKWELGTGLKCQDSNAKGKVCDKQTNKNRIYKKNLRYRLFIKRNESSVAELSCKVLVKIAIENREISCCSFAKNGKEMSQNV